jgi:protein-tyrosine phosphatase
MTARIMNTLGNVELHFHILPGVDDGPSTVQESLALAAAAVSDGARLVVATPHVHARLYTDPDEIHERTSRLRERLQEARIPLRLLPGGELDHTLVERLSQRQLELIAQGPAGRRWLLLEAPLEGLEADFSAAADELRQRGFAIVMAHPERAQPTDDKAAIVEREVSRGSVMQLTAASVIGHLGERERDEALRLLRFVPRAVIASDAHGAWRMPSLTQARDVLVQLGYRSPSRFVAELPAALVERGLEVSPAVKVA